MTSNTAPFGTVTRSGIYSSTYDSWKAFDSSTSTMWLSEVFETPAWIAYDWGSPHWIETYRITYSNGSITTRAPKDFQLQGWNGSTWVTVDSRSGQTGWGGSSTRTYSVASPGYFTKIRLLVTDDNDVRTGVVVISIGDLSLEGCP
jgi:hypothetical protein